MGFEKFSRSYFGKNYEEAKENYETGVAHERLSFRCRHEKLCLRRGPVEDREREKNFHEVPEQGRGTL